MNNPIREICAAILIDTSGRVLLQRRDDKPGILQPGKVGLFGGHREGDESFIGLCGSSPKRLVAAFQPNDFNIYSASMARIRRNPTGV